MPHRALGLYAIVPKAGSGTGAVAADSVAMDTRKKANAKRVLVRLGRGMAGAPGGPAALRVGP